jgi:hypothetical protein
MCDGIDCGRIGANCKCDCIVCITKKYSNWFTQSTVFFETLRKEILGTEICHAKTNTNYQVGCSCIVCVEKKYSKLYADLELFFNIRKRNHKHSCKICTGNMDKTHFDLIKLLEHFDKKDINLLNWLHNYTVQCISSDDIWDNPESKTRQMWNIIMDISPPRTCFYGFDPTCVFKRYREMIAKVTEHPTYITPIALRVLLKLNVSFNW